MYIGIGNEIILNKNERLTNSSSPSTDIVEYFYSTENDVKDNTNRKNNTTEYQNQNIMGVEHDDVLFIEEPNLSERKRNHSFSSVQTFSESDIGFQLEGKYLFIF